jgi:RimJ/RimL family protein N-acetyltransferase
MDHAYDWVLQHNLRVMQLYVTAANERAQAFYRKQGFEDCQVIMRHLLTQADVQEETLTKHPHHQLHFSEGGGRPIDMHGHTHQEGQEIENTDQRSL